MRVRHIAFVVQDLEKSAKLYEEALGFTRVGRRTPGNFPGEALDMTDGELNFSLLRPNEGEPSAWRGDSLGPIHVGVVVDDLTVTLRALQANGIKAYAEKGSPAYFLKFTDHNGVEFDVADRAEPFPT
jgi:catechol 2,3-dioxygenase-like lactoylglutathione lyase family enzyme